MVTFGTRLHQLMTARGMSYRTLAAQVYYSKSYLHRLAADTQQPTPEAADRLDRALNADGTLAALLAPPVDDETDAAELARRINASDVSDETLTRLENSFDALAIAYASTPPGQLIATARAALRQAAQLLDARMTLAHHRRLLVVAGWLSLLTATLHIDLRQEAGARGRLATAADLARHGEHDELSAWCIETRAWQSLINGRYPDAIALSQQAQAAAPRGSSALIQATAQEGRAWARMRDVAATRRCLDAVGRMTSSLPVPYQPEHHYRYDPGKALSYAATTLSWAGDPAAVEYARTVIAELEREGSPRLRRAALARIDLGLALVARDGIDEAASVAIQAIASGQLVRSTWWRATEILTAVEAAGIPEAVDLREVYQAHRP